MKRALAVIIIITSSSSSSSSSSMLKFCFQNKQPKVPNYRDYRNYSSEDLKQDLAAALNDCCDSYDVFEQRFVANLNKNAPKKKKLIRGNNKPHMN